MIVAVDARHLAGGRGVAHYTAALLDALPAGDEYRLVAPSHRRLRYAAAGLVGRPRIDRLAGGADVAWIPAPAPVAAGVPYVLTMHDVSWLERPEDFTAYERLWHRAGRLRRLAERAAAVVCVSAATRDAMQRAWSLPADRVHVVHSGVTAPRVREGVRPPYELRQGVRPPYELREGVRPPYELRQGVRPPYELREGVRPPYFLAVGALEPRKAPDLLVRAHQLARREGLKADLVFAGTGRVPVAGDGVHALGRVEDLGPLYAGATALVMPSYLEGFGFPPLEAALAGTPAIVADLPVYDETLGAAAVRFPAGDERALADALLRVEREAAPVADVSHLTWERAAAALHAILRDAAR